MNSAHMTDIHPALMASLTPVITPGKAPGMITSLITARVFAPMPVSYTHLDVYKRQSQDGIKSTRAVTLLPWSRALAANRLTWNTGMPDRP